MKTNLSETKMKLCRLLVCSLLVVVVLQTCAISVVQAEPEAIPRTSTFESATADSVSVSNGDPNLIATEDMDFPTLISTEDGPMFLENSTINRDDTVISEDDAVPYNPEDAQLGGRQLILAPETKTEDTPAAAYAGVGVLVAAVAVGAVALVAKRSKKTTA